MFAKASAGQLVGVPSRRPKSLFYSLPTLCFAQSKDSVWMEPTGPTTRLMAGFHLGVEIAALE
jgi:hypothetical protein